MKMLILATSSTGPNIETLIKAGQHHRVDYIDLARQFSTQYLDYNLIPSNNAWHKIEERLRTDFRLAWQSSRLIRKERYDLVYSTSERVGIPLTFMLERHVKHVMQIAHSLSPRKLRIIRWLGLPRHWDLTIVPTDAEARILRKTLLVDPEKIQVLHYPVDATYYQPLTKLPPNNEPEHAESLGLSYRDYPTLVKAMRQLPHITMYIRAGSSWVAHAAGYEKVPLPGNIHVKPFVSPHELRECYMRSRFTVIPLRKTTQWSAGCTTVTQSQAMGRAVITTRNPGIGEYMLDGETGLIADPGDADSLAKAIDQLWQDRRTSEAMGRRGRQWVEGHLSYDHWLNAITKILENVSEKS
jgi:glycosyltransferase involved in cell wall biosynthesis